VLAKLPTVVDARLIRPELELELDELPETLLLPRKLLEVAELLKDPYMLRISSGSEMMPATANTHESHFKNLK
jgi:hypothetical protein